MRIFDLTNPEQCEQIESSAISLESPLAKYDEVIRRFQDGFSTEKFDELSIDEKFACLTVPTVLQGILEAVQKQNGGATNRLLGNQRIVNPLSDATLAEGEIDATGTEKTFPVAWRDISQGGKGSALEEVVGYCLSSYYENQFNNGLSVVLDDGSVTRPDIIAFAPRDKTGYSVLGNADLCMIELKCGNAQYLTSQIGHISHQLDGHSQLADRVLSKLSDANGNTESVQDLICSAAKCKESDSSEGTDCNALSKSLLLVTADYYSMSPLAQEKLTDCLDAHGTDLFVLPFHESDFTYALAKTELTDCRHPDIQPHYETVNEYMNAHNYGIEDFSIYSSDPEWQALMRKEHPEYDIEGEKAESSINCSESKSEMHPRKVVEAEHDYIEWCALGGINNSSRTDYRLEGTLPQEIVDARQIFDILDSDSDDFWSGKKTSQAEFIEMANCIPTVLELQESGNSLSEIKSRGGVLAACVIQYFETPIRVMKYDNAYIFCNDGRHRTVAAQLAGVSMPVSIVQEYFKK